MQIKRLLDDREVRVGDRVFDAQGRSTKYKSPQIQKSPFNNVMEVYSDNLYKSLIINLCQC